jgi:hemerythrin-like domain-containing protein
MAIEKRKSPRLIKAVDELKSEHEMFRTGIRRIVHCLEQISATDGAALNTLGDELSVLLQQIDEHNRKEVDLIQESFERDQGGGEG